MPPARRKRKSECGTPGLVSGARACFLAHMLTLDHLVITCADLSKGTAWAQQRLGLPLQPGGKHALMSTHNTLLSLGPDLYLEVIAIDPEAPQPDLPRWFALDERPSEPRLSHWACRTDDLRTALAKTPPGHGTPTAITRGDLSWSMAVTGNGHLPCADTYPALLQWHSALPGPRLNDLGARLTSLTISTPEPFALDLADPRVTITQGPPGLTAEITTPNGPRTL